MFLQYVVFSVILYRNRLISLAADMLLTICIETYIVHTSNFPRHRTINISVHGQYIVWLSVEVKRGGYVRPEAELGWLEVRGQRPSWVEGYGRPLNRRYSAVS